MKTWKPTTSTSSIKKTIISQGLLEYACYICSNEGEWKGQPLVLQLDHVNGDNKDHRLVNLRFLCPNCHSQTETFCGRNDKNYSVNNKKVSDEKLLSAMRVSTTVREALFTVGLSGATNYQRVYRLCKLHNITHLKTNAVKVLERKEILRNSGIDFTKHGALVKAAPLIGLTPQALGRWIFKNYPELLLDKDDNED